MTYSENFPETSPNPPSAVPLVSLTFIRLIDLITIVSTVCTVILAMLTVSELRTYLSQETSTQMFIQTTHRLDTIRVNLDIDMPYMPCDVIGVDVEDSIGNHIQDYYGELHKHRIDADGENINIETWKEKNENRKDLW